jgi:serine/threonine protein kinase
MTLGEQLELAIYRFVESIGKGQGRTVDITTVTGLIPGAHNVDAVDAFIRLHDEGYISLVKYDAGPNPLSFVDMQRDIEGFFYRRSFKVTVTPRGRLDFERKQAAVPLEPSPAKKIKRMFRTALNVYADQGTLGEGGSGTVHRVTDEDGNSYALKLMRQESLGGTRQKRFQHELNFCMKTSHANIVPVIDHGLFGAEERPFFVMSLFDSTLRKAMRKGIEPYRIPQIVRQIVHALEFAHGREIFHRDLKPENILCSADLSSVVLADFGIAHFSEDVLLSAVETNNQERLANFSYAAPEQRVRGSKVGAPADIWALGLILNELFTGQLTLGKGHILIASITPEYADFDALAELMLRQSPDERPAIGTIKPHFTPPPQTGTTNAAVETEGVKEPERGTSEELRSSSPANIWLHIERHPSQPGLIFDVTNRRTKNIKDCMVCLIDARSFDASSGEYRDGFGFKKRRLSINKEILAGDVTTPSGLLRVKDGHLEVGDTIGNGALLWPKSDKSDTQRWALTLSVEAIEIKPWTLGATVEWQRGDNLLRVSQPVGLTEPMRDTPSKVAGVSAARHLDLNQYEGLVTMLSRIEKKTRVTITAFQEDHESWDYAAEISLVFTKAGWAVNSIAQPVMNLGGGVLVIGGNNRWDFVNDAQGNAIELAFRRSGVLFKLANRGDMSADDLEVHVGTNAA